VVVVAGLQAAVSRCFATVPEITFMLGPLDKPPPQKKDRAKRSVRPLLTSKSLFLYSQRLEVACRAAQEQRQARYP
jgi:hypothetical protein